MRPARRGGGERKGAGESALGPNALNLARGDGSDSREDRRNQRPEVPQPIGCGMRDDDPEREPRDWLLGLEAAPAASDHGINVVAGELQGEIYGQVLVKKDAHRPGASRGPGRVRRWPV